ncbi:MAG: hypothetical protein IPK17_25495 [Chloroflexi bacterium]|uniref:hypothetical protein n=1 Tax=Candidatus Flexifilum breve TaxID=3140694 RepID=UPI0031369016|nr:hypothetical protein [Chloroflexota bacterium]
MAADALGGFLRLGFMIGGCGLVMTFVQPRESPQFVLSVCSAALGLVLVVGTIVVMRRLKSDDQP